MHNCSDTGTRYSHPLQTSGNRHPQVDDDSSRCFFRILPRDTLGFSLFPIHHDQILTQSTRKDGLNRFDLFHKLTAKHLVQTSVGHCHTMSEQSMNWHGGTTHLSAFLVHVGRVLARACRLLVPFPSPALVFDEAIRQSRGFGGNRRTGRRPRAPCRVAMHCSLACDLASVQNERRLGVMADRGMSNMRRKDCVPRHDLDQIHDTP